MPLNLRQKLLDIAATIPAYNRIAIAGGPMTGKSLIADTLADRPHIKTDDFMHMDWDTQPDAIIAVCRPLPRFILSGVRTGRVLLVGLEIDLAVWLDTPLHPLTRPQETMRRGCRSIFQEWASLHKASILYR